MKVLVLAFALLASTSANNPALGDDPIGSLFDTAAKLGSFAPDLLHLLQGIYWLYLEVLKETLDGIIKIPIQVYDDLTEFGLTYFLPILTRILSSLGTNPYAIECMVQGSIHFNASLVGMLSTVNNVLSKSLEDAKAMQLTANGDILFNHLSMTINNLATTRNVPVFVVNILIFLMKGVPLFLEYFVIITDDMLQAESEIAVALAEFNKGLASNTENFINCVLKI